MQTAELVDVLRSHWGIRNTDISALHGGMNSAAWEVRTHNQRWAAKLVPSRQRPQFATGLRAAALVQAGGIDSGAPVPTMTGAHCADLDAGCLALLTWVDGTPLAGGEADLATMGSILGAAHRTLVAANPGDAPRFHWVDVDASHLDVEAWVRPAVTAAVQHCDRIAAQGPWALLHGDPSPEAFLWSASTGRCGLIDWSSSFHGPLLYDLASAVMYVGGPAKASGLIASYRSHELLDDDAAAGLPAMLTFRWAVQADYFARRIASNDLTGLADAAENHKGLDDARLRLTET